jgi:guanylate kinase
MEKVIIFCAPSGSGKTTIVKHLLKTDSRLAFSVSACTRAMRKGEEHGKDYYFMSHEEFKTHVAQNDFLEYEEVYGGNFYGTLKSEIHRIWQQGKVVIFDVDVVGGLNIKNYFGTKALGVFVKPPSVEALEKRLRFRSTETEETLKMRVSKAVEELAFETKFEQIILNDHLEAALEQAEEVVERFLSHT